MPEETKRKLSLVGLFAATLFWGASFFLIKKAESEVGLWPYLFWRFFIATVFLAVMIPKKLILARRSTILRGALLGLFLFLALSTQTKGLQTTTASRSGFLTALYVPFIPLLGLLFFRQRLFWRQLLVAFVAVTGMYIMTSPAHGLTGLLTWWASVQAGDILTVMTAVFSGSHILITERVTRREPDSLALGLWQTLWCFVFVGIGCFIFGVEGHWAIKEWSSFSLTSVIFTGIVSTCFGFIMQLAGQKKVGALKAALIFALEAPFSSGFAYVFLGEIMSVREGWGALIVFLTSIIPEPWLKPKSEEQNHGSL